MASAIGERHMLPADRYTNKTDAKLNRQHLREKSNTRLSYCNTHTFNGPLSGTTWVSQYQKGKTNLDFTAARDIEWQWHQLGHMKVCTALQTDSHASTSPLKFFTGRMPFLQPNQECQSTESTVILKTY